MKGRQTLLFLFLSLVVLTGCGPNTYGIARMSTRELIVVSDADLCYSQRHWRTPNLMNEISRRNLDCNVVATRQTTTPTPRNGSKYFQESAETATGSNASLESASTSEQVQTARDDEKCIEYFVIPPNQQHTFVYHSTNNVNLSINQNTAQGMPKITVDGHNFYPNHVSYTDLTHYGSCSKNGSYEQLDELPKKYVELANKEFTYYPAPFTKGTSWQSDNDFFTWSHYSGKGTVKVTNVYEDVGFSYTVPAGTYKDCLKMHSTGSAQVANGIVSTNRQAIFCKGVGIVANRDEERHNRSGSIKVVEYALNSIDSAPAMKPDTAALTPASPNTETPSKPVTCGDTAFKNLKADQGKALQFLLERDLVSPKIGCITELTATDKFPLRGQTVVKYQATVLFPNGYRIDCLQRKALTGNISQEGVGFGAVLKELDCSDIGIAPAKVGETRTYSGEEII